MTPAALALLTLTAPAWLTPTGGGATDGVTTTLAAATPAAPTAAPAWATAGLLLPRLAPGSGSPDAGFEVRRPAGGQVVIGDWNGDGAASAAVFVAGRWSVYERVVGHPTAVRTFGYGTAGDVALAGDWDGDGVDGIGVRRKGVWYLRQTATGGSSFRTFRYGPVSGDQPVTGDWNGDGVDGVGSRFDGRWSLRETATGGPATRVFSYGRATDQPVSGDWDGDRGSGVAVVRGSTWFLRQAATGGTTDQTRTITRPSGAAPVAWPHRGGPDGSRCPTASSAMVGRTAWRYVVPSPLLNRAAPTTGSAPGLRAALLTAERYLLATQYPTTYARYAAHPYLNALRLVDRLEIAVRGPAMVAQTVALSLRTGAYDPAVTGMSRSAATRYAGWLVGSLACQHRVITPGGWGAGWQTAHWAMLTGEAGWLLWDVLPPPTREYVAAMLTAEADRRANLPAEYWQAPDGRILTPGDTKAEENSWNAALLELAIRMMPAHPRATAWRSRAIELEMAAHATLQDNGSTTRVNGLSVAGWVGGANAYADGTLVNHNRIHPDYMSTVQQLWWSADFAGLAGRSTPRAALHNGALTYGSFTKRVFASPPFAAPGGTIYRPGSGSLYFPQGSDWGPLRRAHFVSLDAHALLVGADSTASWPAGAALAAHLQAQRDLQARHADGRTYRDSTEDVYPAREEYAAHQLASGWLALYVRQHAPMVLDDGSYAPPPDLGGTAAGTGRVAGPRSPSVPATGDRPGPATP